VRNCKREATSAMPTVEVSQFVSNFAETCSILPFDVTAARYYPLLESFSSRVGTTMFVATPLPIAHIPCSATRINGLRLWERLRP